MKSFFILCISILLLSLACEDDEDKVAANVAKINFADSLHEVGDFSNAIKLYNQVLDIDKNNIEVLIKLGSTYNDSKDFEKALDVFNSILNINSNHSEGLGYRGFAKMQLMDSLGAMADFNKSLSLFPNSAKVLNDRGRLLFASGKIEEAIIDYNQSIKLDPEMPYAYVNRAKIKSDIYEDYEGAIVDYSKALVLFQNDKIYFGRGICYLYIGQFDKSYNDLLTAIQLQPNESRYYLNMAYLLLELQKKSEACEYMIKAADLGNKDAIEYLKQSHCNKTEV